MNSIGRGIAQDNQHIIKQKVHLFKFLKTIKQNSIFFHLASYFLSLKTQTQGILKKRICLSKILTFYVSTIPQKEKKRYMLVKENRKLK